MHGMHCMRFFFVVVVRFVDRCLYTWSVLDRCGMLTKKHSKRHSRRVVKREKSVAGVMLKEEKVTNQNKVLSYIGIVPVWPAYDMGEAEPRN